MWCICQHKRVNVNGNALVESESINKCGLNGGKHSIYSEIAIHASIAKSIRSEKKGTQLQWWNKNDITKIAAANAQKLSDSGELMWMNCEMNATGCRFAIHMDRAIRFQIALNMLNFYEIQECSKIDIHPNGKQHRTYYCAIPIIQSLNIQLRLCCRPLWMTGTEFRKMNT